MEELPQIMSLDSIIPDNERLIDIRIDKEKVTFYEFTLTITLEESNNLNKLILPDDYINST